ncbi:hypothetical protein QQ39_14355 [Pragia fontium]|nr:hypothetical protein QQ39_14355 [Pragia fontium]
MHDVFNKDKKVATNKFRLTIFINIKIFQLTFPLINLTIYRLFYFLPALKVPSGGHFYQICLILLIEAFIDYLISSYLFLCCSLHSLPLASFI